MSSSETRKKLKEIEKTLDKWGNREFTGYRFQSLNEDRPKIFNDYARDKHKEIDAPKRMLGKNKRKRRRDVIKKPENI